VSFLNPALLGGLALIAIPIIIHLLNRRTAKVLDWGAMRFLLESVESRKKRIQLEEALLLAARCLLAGLLALAVARPFVPPGSSVPWLVVLPAFLVGLVSFTTALVLRGNRKWFWILMSTAALLAIVSAASVIYERQLNLKRFGTGGGKDIAIVLDASTSMQLRSQGGTGTVFEAAVAEARAIVDKAPPGSSFSLILGGPVPVARLPEPVVNRLDVTDALKSLQPGRGKMAAFDALAAAAVSLARGSNPAKEIVVLTDGQNTGWEIANKARWDALVAGLSTLPSAPQVILRRFPLPDSFRNAAIAKVGYSREVIGVDRPVSIEVTVENTGTEAITPEGLDLTVEGQTLKDASLGQLPPGARQTVRFLHQFKKPGNLIVEAKLLVTDDLTLDDSAASVCQVIDRLGVLIVDGNPAGSFLERAGAFTALALAPASALRAKPENNQPQDKPPVALDPEVLPLSRLASLESFAPYDVVILCDVPKLADSSARRLAAWVQAGGGLLVTPGSRALPDFYNNWRDAGGQPFLPARLAGERISKDSIGVAMASFSHPALTMVADAKQSDLGGALFTRSWRLDAAGEGNFTGAKLGNGDPLLTGRKFGFGTVLMTCVNLDASGSNLPSRQAFVPLVHQLVYHLANPEGQPLNRAPAARIDFPLSSGMADGGLRGEYFKGRQLKEPVLVRIDGKLDFQWGNNSPGPGVPEDFTARWTGMILPKYSEEYLFDGWGDDSLSVFIDEKQVFERGGEGRVTLEAGRYYPIRLEFFDRSGGASLQLSWRSQSQQREVIPAGALTPFAPGNGKSELAVGRWDVAGPDGRNRQAELLFTRSGLVARLGGDMVPGLYRMTVPAQSAAQLSRWTGVDGTIPFTVTDDAAESRMQPLADTDLAALRQRLKLVEAKSAAEVVAALTGKQFGEELWKYLAVGALFLLLMEIALSRWIALSRRSGVTKAVDFENRHEPSAQFKEQLRRVHETAGIN
jgi:PA14 domain/Aerotolerance regulator N-terminal/von Willebrand factor type A domain